MVMVVMAGAYVVRRLGFLVMASPGEVYPDNGSGNPFLIFRDAPIQQFDVWVTALQGVVIGVVGVLAMIRWIRASPPLRRVLAPVLIGGLGWVIASVIYKVGPWADFTLDFRFPPWQDEVWWSIPDYLVRGAAAPIGFLVGALLLRTARVAVVDLLSGIAEQPARRNLQESLIRVLGDTDLVVLYPDGDSWIDVDGRPVVYPNPMDERVATPIESDGRPVAIILHDASLLEDPGLVGAVAATARLAIDNERLSAELEAQLAEVRESRVRNR